jgi:hypothetical protein
MFPKSNIITLPAVRSIPAGAHTTASISSVAMSSNGSSM